MYHGATALTLIPSFAHSHARYLVSMFIAALVMAYTTPLCMDTSEATLELNRTHASRGLHQQRMEQLAQREGRLEVDVHQRSVLLRGEIHGRLARVEPDVGDQDVHLAAEEIGGARARVGAAGAGGHVARGSRDVEPARAPLRDARVDVGLGPRARVDPRAVARQRLHDRSTAVHRAN